LNDLQAYIDAMNGLIGSKSSRAKYWANLQNMLQEAISEGDQMIDDLYDRLRDPTTPPNTVFKLCNFILFTLERQKYGKKRLPHLVDRRSAVYPLLAALKHPDEDVQQHVLSTLGWLRNKRAFQTLKTIALSSDIRDLRLAAIKALGNLRHPESLTILLSIIMNREAPEADRQEAIMANLWWYKRKEYPLIRSTLATIAQDDTEEINIRAKALYYLSFFATPDTVNILYDFLEHPIPNLRFWAVSGLGNLDSQIDISDALTVLDNMVARDHVIVDRRHISREALRAFDQSYYRKLAVTAFKKYSPNTFLISPLAEYYDFSAQSRQAGYQPIKQTTTLNIDPRWLIQQITEKWHRAKINIRSPKPQSLSVDWFIKMETAPLIGGLLVDSYSIVLTGHKADVLTFAKWYQSIIDDKYTLRIYPWADEGILITPDLDVLIY